MTVIFFLSMKKEHTHWITRVMGYLTVCTTFFMLFLHRQKKYYSHSLNIKVLKYWTSDDRKFLLIAKSTCHRKKSYLYTWNWVKCTEIYFFLRQVRAWMMNKWQGIQLHCFNIYYIVVIQIRILWFVVIYYIYNCI